MTKTILVNSSHYETRVATLEDGEIRHLHIEREEDRNVVGNVYKGIVKRVLPGMQAAFLELGLERTAFLYVDDIIDEPFGTDIDYVDEQTETEGSEEDLDSVPEETEADGSGGSSETAVESEGSKAAPLPDDWDERNVGLVVAPKQGQPQTESQAAKSAPEETSPEAELAEGADFDERQTLQHDFDEGTFEESVATESSEDGNQDADEGEDAEGGDSPEESASLSEESSESESQDSSESRERNTETAEGEGSRSPEASPRGEGQSGKLVFGRRGGRPGPTGSRGASSRRDRGGRSRRGKRAGRSSGGRGQRSRGKRPRGSANIQDLLQEGQEILVQVAKAPIGTKGARLTTHISLPGRNLVLMPTVKHLGISRRIGSDRERRRLRDIFLRQIRANEVGFIIRTVAEGKSLKELKADADYLLRLWDRIKRESARKRAPALIHEDLSLGMRAVRDFFTDEVDSFIIDNPTEHDKVMSFVTQFIPRLKGRVKLFRGPSQLFEHYGIEAEISRALGKKVWLKSGGYLLIDQSEALTAIDVNTGRYVGSRSLEETILKTNLEAVKEIAYQLRVRNVGGIIIIDLIDMESFDNRDKVYSALQDALGEDRAKTNILKISDLGLVEMTRKRTHEDLVRYLTEACTHCEGRGYHKSRRTVCFEIFREIEKEGLTNNTQVMVFANPAVIEKVRKDEWKHVTHLQERFKKRITVAPDPQFHMEQFEVYGKP